MDEEYYSSGMRQLPFKGELENSIIRKLRDLGSFPVCITPELKNEIQDLIDEFLDLRQEKKFTINRGVEMEKQIDVIFKNRTIACNPKLKVIEEDDEDRKRKPTSSKSKRKVCKCKR